MIDLRIILEPDELLALANGETIQRSDILYDIKIVAKPPVDTTVEEDIKLMQLRVITPDEFLKKHGFLKSKDVHDILVAED